LMDEQELGNLYMEAMFDKEAEERLIQIVTDQIRAELQLQRDYNKELFNADGTPNEEKVAEAKAKAAVSANDALAQSTLRALSTASEVYASDSNGKYPEDMGVLVNVRPPYLNVDYCDATVRSGFRYECSLSAAGYTFIATPEQIGVTGSMSFKMVTGGILTKE